jgi:hypothetical protein
MCPRHFGHGPGSGCGGRNREGEEVYAIEVTEWT